MNFSGKCFSRGEAVIIYDRNPAIRVNLVDPCRPSVDVCGALLLFHRTQTIRQLIGDGIMLLRDDVCGNGKINLCFDCIPVVKRRCSDPVSIFQFTDAHGSNI